MATTYEIDISLSNETVVALKSNGYALYGFKAVKSPIAGGAPLVWFATTSYMTRTAVTWQDRYQAYISASEIIANGLVVPVATCDIDLGQRASVTPDGALTLASGGLAGAISIVNPTITPWVAGLAQAATGWPSPVCAMPLYGNMLDVIVPVEHVLLMFAAFTVDPGAAVFNASASGLFVDLTGAPRRAVSFDWDQGWSQDASWGRPVPKNAALGPLLITS